MPFSTGNMKAGVNLAQVDTTAAHNLGSEVIGDDGATYRYIKAASAIAANDILYQPGTTLDNWGPVSAVAQRLRGVAPIAIASGSFGWAIVRGPASAKMTAATAANVTVGSSGTAGTGVALAAGGVYAQAEITAAIAAAGGVGMVTTAAEAGGKAGVMLG